MSTQLDQAGAAATGQPGMAPLPGIAANIPDAAPAAKAFFQMLSDLRWNGSRVGMLAELHFVEHGAKCRIDKCEHYYATQWLKWSREVDALLWKLFDSQGYRMADLQFGASELP